MLWFLLLLLIPIAYAGLYVLHSVRKKRRKQALAVGSLLMLNLAAAALLLWEFVALP